VRAALKTLEEGTLKQQDADVVAFNLFLGADGPVRKLLDPFVSESIALERISDVIPSGILVGGRGGVTKTGKVVYSETDDGPTAFMKSLVHIIEGVQPTAITTGEKIIAGIEKDIKRGGQPVSLQDELLALFSGVRIINVDVPKAMEFKITDYNKKFRSTTKAEKFFSLEDFQNRGPLVMADEFRNIQDETFRVNQDFYFILQDAIATGVKERDLLKILRNRNISFSKAKKLIKGQNIPFTAYEERMKDRVKEAEIEAKRRGETINKEYFYPKKLFRDILKEYKNKDLNIKEDEQLNEIDRILKLQSDKVSSVPQVTEDRAFAELTTPPLPNTPMPVVQTAALPGTNTNLTRTQQALLSPEEQVIASRRT
jgi:hypothetical protein